MATLFQRTGSKTWIAKIKLWDAAKNAWVWKSQTTHLTDKQKALAFAVTIEGLSGEARSGNLTRDRVTEVINHILRTAGISQVAAAPSLRAFARTCVDKQRGETAERTLKQYRSMAGRLEEHFKDRDDRLNLISNEDIENYYRSLKGSLAVHTANLHMTFLSSIFKKALAQKLVTWNPVSALVRTKAHSVRREPLTRAETALVLRAMRKEGRRDWCLLTLLGFHTGHRIGDLVSLTRKSLKEIVGVGWVVEFMPDKRKEASEDEELVRLPIPDYLAIMLCNEADGLAGLHRAEGDGYTSALFIDWLERAGVQFKKIKRGQKTLTTKSFHSFRHRMVSQLTAEEVPDRLSMLVTDHTSPRVHQRYAHKDLIAIAGALRKVRYSHRAA